MREAELKGRDQIEIYPYGESAVRIEFGKGIDPEINRKVRALTANLESEPFPGMIECVSAFTSVTVFYDLLAVRNMASPLSESQSAYEIVSDLVRERAAGMATEASGQARTVEIPVCYGGSFGPDLAYVAEHNKLTPSEVIDIHTSGEYLVYMIGFAPGFPFLGGLSERIATPRRSSPRLSIPAGSVGIAGKQTGVYPIVTPGGWQLIGSTPLALFRPEHHPPSLLQAGDVVKFRAITPAQYEEFRGGRI
ncbi:5-oxoprolinase subunit PxpB [Paenibacillus sp. 7541]|uniref:5-oxoprolinase subunit PxpB n=1 Tax=Paenibacillus sp. 7541 TaxID=2026236 RepID=UPI000BA571F7|nr:5-oxoprolinase subunit PxpB [Paenibacillus sp. 7541]PAK54276.1 kinase inhibitor [Paenibacillus sp. 7541]